MDSLIIDHEERIPAKSFTLFKKIVAKELRGKAGLYALYKGNELYYVGLATNLNVRILQHDRDKHRGKWDSFSIYVVEKVKYLKDIESLVLHIAEPVGNKQQGNISKSNQIRKKLLKEAGQKRIEYEAYEAAISGEAKGRVSKLSGWEQMKLQYPTSKAVDAVIAKAKRKGRTAGWIETLKALKSYWRKRGK